MSNIGMLLTFWGKTPRAGEAAERFHPAIYHMLDVAFVAEALLRDGSPRLRRALLHAWQGCDSDALIAWLPFLIATHDLGKISAAFQGQVEPQRDRLLAQGIACSTHGAEPLYHAEISAVWLHTELKTYAPGVARRLLWTLRDAMGGHHGRFSQHQMKDIESRLARSERSESRWKDWRAAAYQLLRECLAPPGDLAMLGEPKRIRAATAALTGFIVWCDWMGSNERDFPASPELLLEQYLLESRKRAKAALATHRLAFTRPTPTYSGYGGLFSDPPRALQRLVDVLPAALLREPSLTVIEAPTGEGKTEAALALARRIAAANGSDEVFFALPTMATGNQMFRRLTSFYNALYNAAGAVRLAHGQAAALEEDLRRAALAGDRDSADPDGRSADAALEWFVGSKKAMLAPFGVGTVDQVELAGLNVRHYPLRLFGLAGKVVVIDEVHAYDAYMSAILEHTLRWLAALGCSVILLSATLPVARHQALTRAFREGLGGSPVLEMPPDLPYPCVSVYTATDQLRDTCAVFRGEQRFTLRLADQRAPAEEADYLLSLVREGGAVARLCNRVDDAQAIYAALRGRMPADSQVLLHARFPLEARRSREERIADLLGKTSTRAPEQPLIIVGTQVLEQSLDYDVDVMISDFAPLDLLLQRAGRLQRHQRARPARHKLPVLEVTLPRAENGQPDWRRWAPIYAPYILWRSYAALRAGMAGEERVIVLPRDYRPLIEAVYGADPAASSQFAAEIANAWQRYERETNEQQAKARQPLTPDPMSRDAIVEGAIYDFIDDESGQAANWQLAKTRLGDRVTVVPVYRVDGRLTFDAQGTRQISPDVPPDLDQVKEFIERSVPISDKRIIKVYRDENRARALRWPWNERQIPALLRSLYPLPLDQSHTRIFDDRVVRLDTELGLVIEKGVVIEEEL